MIFSESFVETIGKEMFAVDDQSWVFIGRTEADAETLILWPPHAKS